VRLGNRKFLPKRTHSLNIIQDKGSVMNNFFKQIDKISRWAGSISSWFILLQMLVTVAIVIERHFFHRGDDWAFELSWMFYSLVFLFAFAFTLAEKGHVKVDVLSNRYSFRVRAIVDSISYLALVVICSLMVWNGIFFAKTAWVIKECSWHTTAGAPVYPIKTMIPFAFGLLGLQGIVEFIRSLTLAVKGKKE
jgi:TRAP-type mannitol/chloroaromatic compound transport system permease small subunit